MLAVLEHLEADSLTFARFAAITDTLRRETLRRIADEMDVPTKAELLAGAHFLETPDSSIGSVAALRVAAYLRARAGEIE